MDTIEFGEFTLVLNNVLAISKIKQAPRVSDGYYITICPFQHGTFMEDPIRYWGTLEQCEKMRKEILYRIEQL